MNKKLINIKANKKTIKLFYDNGCITTSYNNFINIMLIDFNYNQEQLIYFFKQAYIETGIIEMNKINDFKNKKISIANFTNNDIELICNFIIKG